VDAQTTFTLEIAVGIRNFSRKTASNLQRGKYQDLIRGSLDLSFVDEYKRIFDKRRKKAFELFNSIPGVSMSMPESSYLSWVDVSKLGTSAEVSKYILDNAQVVVNEGTPYGPGGEGYLRIVHGCYRDETVVETVLRRIRDALLKLSVEKL
jgi:bifunctional pyridoxal-dependent enzyme with beta-cystathionase and maltose regulon repressor activities